ncbi:MAG TPA: hypothetical protein VH008_10635 [Pseudonocardia sp.]|jgi:hypothetical protein|nr:hypothetical protein [Pseudonocardia sp.]
MTKIGELAQQLSSSPAGFGVLVTRLDEVRSSTEPDVPPAPRVGADQPDPYPRLNIPELYLG